MECTAAIQHADLECDELDVLSRSEIFPRLMSVDWQKEVSCFAERHLLQQETCPPGFYVYRPSAEYLACYPASESRFILNFCLIAGRTFLGKERWREITLQPAGPEKVREMIEAFATLRSDELLSRLESEDAAEPGVFSSEKRS